jgi:hypothetical protein
MRLLGWPSSHRASRLTYLSGSQEPNPPPRVRLPRWSLGSIAYISVPLDLGDTGCVDTITQVITVAAVVLGALTSYLTNFLMERTKQRASLRTRWDERKLEAYVAYVDSVRTSIYAATLLHGGPADPRNASRSEADLMDDWISSTRARAMTFERVMLLAGAPVIEMAHEVQEAVAEMGWQASGAPWRARWKSGDSAALLPSKPSIRFHQRARADLGVSGPFDGERNSARGLLLPDTRLRPPAKDNPASP